MSRAVLASLLLVAGCAAGGHERNAAPASLSWRQIITPSDRDRLRGWRDAWTDGLAQARLAGAGSKVAAEGVLLDPDAALEQPDLPEGAYRCRTIKLGAQGPTGARALAYVAYPAFACDVAGGRLIKRNGSQRPAGMIWPMDATKLLFLGSMALGDEPRAMDYGRDAERDIVGVIERIGPHRWRLVMPRPHWESQIDVMELLPVSG